MTGCGNNKYTQSEFDGLITSIFEGNHVEYINAWFDPDTANTLLRGISLDPSNINGELKSLDEIFDFLESLDPEETPFTEIHEGNDPKYAVESDTEEMTAYAEFVEYGGVRQEYDALVDLFKTQVIERTLLSNGKLIDPADVSKNLHAYKMELLSRLYEFVAPGQELPIFASEEKFTRFLNTVLIQAELKGRRNSDFNNYLNDFILLKNFDKLILDEFDHISIKPEYAKSNLISEEMYESTGPFNYKDRFASYSEAAGTEDYTSSFVKLLLWYFKVDGRPIGLDSFQAISGEIMEMVETPIDGILNERAQRALYEGIDKSLDQGENGGIKYLFKSFIESKQTTPKSKKIAKAIYDNIFSSESPLDNKIKKIFLNQFITSVRYAYLAYRTKFDPDLGQVRMISELLQSELINKQTYNIQRAIKAQVYNLSKNPEILAELIEKYDIQITSNSVILNANGNSKISLYTDASLKETPYAFGVETESEDSTRYSINTKAGNVATRMISKDFVKEFIENVTGLTLPDEFVEIYTVSNPNSDNSVWESFARIGVIVLSATATTQEGAKLFDKYQYLYRNEELKLASYFKDFEPLGNFFSVVYGTEYNTVIQNAEGNNLPTSQLRSSIFDVKREIYSIHNRAFKQRSNLHPINRDAAGNIIPVEQIWGKHVFGANHLYTNPEIVGIIAMRSDTKLNDQAKVAQQLLPSEVLHEAIDIDFYHSLMGENALGKSWKKTGKRLETNTSIWLQPIVYSDKRTHFIVEFRVDKLVLRGKRFSNLLKSIATFDSSRISAIETIENDMMKIRLDKYEKQAENLISRFSTALNWSLTRNEGESIRNYFNRAKGKLHEFYLQHGKDTLTELENAFGTTADIYNDADISTAESEEVFFNPTLDAQIDTYSDKAKFDARMRANKINFIRTLIDAGYMMDPAYNPNFRSIIESLRNDKNGEWFDDYDGSMKLFIAKDESGKEIAIDWVNMYDLDWDTIDFQLNPILESYFYADTYLSNQYVDICFGDVNGYTAKHKDYKLKDVNDLLNSMFIIEDESSRLADMAKRTVNAGASRITFAQGMKYGIGPKALISNVKDLLGPAFNFTGTIDKKFKTLDGCTFVHAVFARLQNYSLLDRRVGNQRKKTFGNGIDPETGTAWELKHAEYTLTNEYRRIGSEYTDYSYEVMYKKASSLKSDKFGKIDLSRYYGQESHKNSDGENITLIQPIYRYNLDSLAYEKLARIEQDGTNVKAYWQLCKEDGTEIPGVITAQDFYIDDLYALDQLFGGAYCAIWDNKANQFKWSEINQDLLAVIVCEEDLKTDFISLISNKSATKVGVRNLNPSNIFNAANSDPLKYWEFSTLCYGIQMNPDHDIEDDHGVREMSQMISALIQGGYLTGKVMEIYRMIGNVALDSVRTTIDAVEEKDQDKIYEIVGNALVKAFDTNQRDVLGLAQSFIAMANKDLATGSFKTRIPFSANTIKGSFQATITSFLNKDAIRRRYSGLGGINTPSNGGIQYFQWTDKKTGEIYNLTWLEFVKVVGGRRNAEAMLTNKKWNGLQFENPTIIPIDKSQIRFGDTILFINQFNVPIEKKISTPEDLYNYKYNSNYGQLYKWTVKPKDLASSDISFTVGNKEFTIWDTDLVRIINESQNIIEKPELFYTIIETKDSENNVISRDIELTNRGIMYYNLLRNAFSERTIIPFDISDATNIQDYFIQAKWDVSNKLLPLLSQARDGKTMIPVQESMKENISSIEDWDNDQSVRAIEQTQNILITKVDFKALQVGIGKRNAAKLGLKPGVTLNDVRKQKANYFRKQLKERAIKPPTVDPDLYDAVLYNKNGDATLVIVGDLYENSERLSNFEDNFNYKLRGKNYWKNGVDYGTAEGIVFKTFIDEFGKSFDVAVVTSWNALSRLANNGLYSNTVYNYTYDNWQSLVKHRFKNNFDKQGKLVKDIFTSDNAPKIKQTVQGELSTEDSEDELIFELNRNESNRQNNFINRRAEQMYEAFEMQLKVIIDRIPSQSMQSFLSADVAILLETEENLMAMSYFLLWLQGADLDIDKSFTITYEVGDDGRVITPSKLDRYYSAEKVLSLPLPDRRKFKFYSAEEYAKRVLAKEIPADATRIFGQNLTRRIPIELLDSILSGSTNVVFDEDVDVEIRNRIEELIELHQSSINLPNSIKVAGYKNRVVHIIHDVLRDPIVQVQTNVPVEEAMDDLKNSIPKPKFKVELFRTWDNPAAKFAIQRDNMVGRDVIGISAVSLKAFFAESAYGNQLVSEIISLVNQYKNKLEILGEEDVELGNAIINHLKKICFDAKFKIDENVPSGIATIANLRYHNLLKYVSANLQGGIVYTESLDTPRLKNLNKYKSVINGKNVLDITTLAHDLNVYANGTYKSPKNAALVLSGYTSLATDNAKELQLVKMNATSKFADIHTYLATIGVRPKDVISFMASPEFNLIARFSEGTILDPNTSYFNVRNALDFVRDQKCLPVMKDAMFISALTERTKNKSFLELLSAEQLFEIATTVDSDIYRIWPSKEEANRVIDKAIKDKTARGKIVAKIYEILRRDPNVEQLLLQAVKGGIKNSTARYTKSLYDEDELLEQEYSQEDFLDESDLDNEFYDQDEFFETWDLKQEDWIEVYRYLKNYLLPKNRALRTLPKDWESKYDMLSTILDSMEEQQMLGALCGINQGLDTGDYDEYKRVRRVEKFINKRYRDYLQKNPNKSLDRFDFIQFLTDPKEQEKQIKQYELVASTYNILDMITSIPHYNAMSKLIATNRYLIQRSVALKMERDLANAILSADKPNEKGFTYGDTQQLNEKEWRILRNYVNDLLILKWFENQPNLSIGVPTSKIFYHKGKDQKNEKRDLSGKISSAIPEINLNNLDGLATFKRLMDSTIIPALKKAFPKNAFLKDLIIGSIHNKSLDRLQTFYCPSFDLTEANRNGVLSLKYKDISVGFNELAKQQLPENLAKQFNTETTSWRIGDLFFIYNLLVHKDGFSTRSFTKLFEDSNTSKDKFIYNRQYYEYLSKLDSREIDYRELFAKELFSNPNPRTKAQTNDYLIDLRIRLADTPNAEYKFKVSSSGIGQSYDIHVFDTDGEERALKFWNSDLNPSDYTLWFPYKLWMWKPEVIAKMDERLAIKSGILSDSTFSGVSSLVMNAIVDRLREITGGKVNISFITTQEINDAWISGEGEIKFANKEDYLRTREANAFVYNGNIYINDKKATIDKPIHEFLHLVTAAMKYNGDRNIRAKYYSLLDEVANDPENIDRYTELKKEYGRKDSDVKEELLVELLSNRFAAQFESNWREYRSKTTTAIAETDVIGFTIDFLNNILGSAIPIDIEPLTLGNTDLRTILSLFGTTINGTDKPSLATIILSNDMKVREIKNNLINKKGDTNITFNGDCI